MLFWTGSGFSPEFPDAEVFQTRKAAEAALVMAAKKAVSPQIHDDFYFS